MVGVFSAMEVAASGLSAERTRMNTIASNLANAKTTRTAEGGPYKRLDPVFQAVPLERSGVVNPLGNAVSTVQVSKVQQDTRDPMLVYEPGHPDADASGYVRYPNVNVVEEMVNMITASRAYEAGITSIESIKAMARSALAIGR
jgi:flagellar basal-body rod protein FlgC